MKPKSPALRRPSASLKSLSLGITFAGVGFLFQTDSAHAASATWNATPTNGIWEAAGAEANWSTGAATFPGAIGTTNNADLATFTTSSQTTISINSTAGNSSALNIGKIAITGASPSAFTFGSSGANAGNALLFTANGNTGNSSDANIYMNGSGTAANQTFNAPILLQGNAFFNNQSNANLLVNGNISGNASGTYMLTMRGNSNSGTIYGNISNGAATSLGVAGNVGSWTLAGNNSYTGATQTNGGLISVTGTNSGGGSYVITGGSGTAITINSSGTVKASGITFTGGTTQGRVFTLQGGTFESAGNIFGAAGAVPGGASTAAANIVFNGGTLKSGNAAGISMLDFNNTVELTGTATFDVSVGNITLGNSNFNNLNKAVMTGAGAVTVTGGNTLKAAISTSGLVTLQNNAAWDMDGTASSLAGLSGINGSVTNTGAAQTLTLNVTSGSQTFGGGIGGGANVAVAKIGAGTQVLSGANTYSGATTVSVGTLQLANANAAQNSTVSISTANGLAFSTGIGTFNLGGLSGASSQSLTDTGAGAVTLSVGANDANTTYSGALSGAGGLSKTGAGSLSLTGSNSYSGNTAINSGTLSIGGAGQIGSGNYAGNISIATAAVFEHASSASTTVGGATNRITGLGSITKSGSGTLRINASQSFSGGVNLIQGILEYDGVGALGTGTITVGAGEITARGGGGILANNVVLNGNVQLGRSGVGSGMGFSGNFDLGGAVRTITMDGAGIVLTGTITNGGLAKSGASTLQISNSGNTYSSGTVLNAGILEYTGAGTLGTGTVTINGGELTARGAGGTLANNFLINGDFQLGRNAIGAGIGISGNVDLGGGTRTITTPGVDVTIGGIVSNGGLTKAGASKITLSGTNTYTGATAVSAGTLLIGTGGSITSDVSVASGATLGGSGTITGNVTLAAESSTGAGNGGKLAAGSSPGILTVDSGTTTLNSGSIFDWELNGNVDDDAGIRGTNYDGLTSINGGDLTVASGAIFRVILTDTVDGSNAFWNTTRSWSDIFSIAGTTTMAGANLFDTVQILDSTTGSLFTPVNGTFSFTGSTLTWSAVPEPSTALAGLLLTAGLIRRRRH